jgi:hypothetical protein
MGTLARMEDDKKSASSKANDEHKMESFVRSLYFLSKRWRYLKFVHLLFGKAKCYRPAACARLFYSG